MNPLISMYSKEYENAVFSACLLQPGYAAKWVGKIKPQHFYQSFLERLFRETEIIINNGREPSIIELSSKLSAEDHSQLYEITENFMVLSNESYAYYELERFRKLRAAGVIMVQLESAREENNAVETAVNELLKISQESESENEQYDMRTLTTRAMERWNNSVNNRQVFKLPFPKLGEHIKLRAGNLMYIIAPPKTGKTWFLCSMAAELAKAAKVLFISAEMCPDDLYTRFASHVCNVDMTTMDDPETMNKKTMDKYSEKITDINLLNVTIANAVGISLTQLTGMIRTAYARGFKVVFIDYLQRIHNPDAKDIRQSIGQVSAMLADSSKRYNQLIVCASQAGRVSNTSEHTEIYHAKESGNIEADADVLLTLKDSTEYGTAFDPHEPRNSVKIKLVQRNGLSFQTELGFSPITGTYWEMEKK